MVRHDRVLQSHLAERYLLIGVGELLEIVVAGDERIEKSLRRAGFQ